MAIITFWNYDREQSGETLAAVAVATKMAIERNLKTLLISTSYEDNTIKNCYWKDSIIKKKNLLGGTGGVSTENGVEGLFRLIASNKIEPSIITDYTHVILKNRLEVLCGYYALGDKTKQQNLQEYYSICKGYPELLKLANQYYDMVIVDLDRHTEVSVRDEILDMSNLNLYVTTQRITNVDKYISLRNSDPKFSGLKNMTVIGKYDDKSAKYNRKNLGRYIGERGELAVVPYNTLFFEAAEEANVVDTFLRLSEIKDKTDENYIFMEEIRKIVERIINRLQELQMKMR